MGTVKALDLSVGLRPVGAGLLDRDDEEYYAAIRANTHARAVKLADIDDNTADWRVAQLDDATRERLAAKYAKARAALGA